MLDLEPFRRQASSFTSAPFQSLRSWGSLPAGAAPGDPARDRVRRPRPDPGRASGSQPSGMSLPRTGTQQSPRPPPARLGAAERISKILFEKVPDLVLGMFSKINNVQIGSDWEHLLSIRPLSSSPGGQWKSNQGSASLSLCKATYGWTGSPPSTPWPQHGSHVGLGENPANRLPLRGEVMDGRLEKQRP